MVGGVDYQNISRIMQTHDSPLIRTTFYGPLLYLTPPYLYTRTYRRRTPCLVYLSRPNHSFTVVPPLKLNFKEEIRSQKLQKQMLL
jgi:hypothetical protein